MNSYRVVRGMRQSAFAACIFAALSLPAVGQVSLGGVNGVARDSASGKPLADAQIIARDMRKNTESTAVSSSNGAFVIALQPGWYEVTATKNGFVKVFGKGKSRPRGKRLPGVTPARGGSRRHRVDNVAGDAIHEGPHRATGIRTQDQ